MWKGLKLLKNITNTAVYGKKQQLTLLIPLIFEGYIAERFRAVMMLYYSKDDKIQQNSQKVHPH